jgi:hypothetical protein
MESLVKLRMEKLSSHFMGHFASFPFTRYWTEMSREYMLLVSPFAPVQQFPWKRLYQWFIRLIRVRTIQTRVSGRQNPSLKVQKRFILLKTNAYLWHPAAKSTTLKKSRVAENTGFKY